MKAYIRLFRRNKHQKRYQIISGTPETHEDNTVLEEWYTRRQALRKAKDLGCDLVIRGRANDWEAA